MFRATLRASAVVGALALAPSSGDATEIYADGELIVTLIPGGSIDAVNATWGTTLLDSFPSAGLYLLYAEGVGNLEAFADSMALNEPIVHEAEANYFEDTPEGVRQMVLVAVGGTVTDYEDQNLTDRIGLDEAHTWAQGDGVTVAVLDTGIDPTHEAFAGRLAVNGYDFVDDDTDPTEVANGLDDDGDEEIDEGFGHGTMVAGIVSLVAPRAMILPIRVLDDEGRADAWLLVKAISYAIEANVDVINMSFGVPRTISSIGNRVSYAHDMNIAVVAGAGNEDSSDPVYYPGAHSKTILVTALDSVDVKADFADYASKVLVSAPGTGVRSAYPGGEWALGSGCSFATPFVTGEVALILSLRPWVNPDDVEERVEAAVDPIYQIPGNAPYDGKLGSGRIFLPDAVMDLVTAVPEPGPSGGRLRVSPNPMHRTLHVHVGTFAAVGTSGPLRLDIFSASGRRVRTLTDVDGASVTWDGLDGRGRELASGVYYVRLSDTAHTLGAARIQKLR